ncbi:MAG: hypothetical protein GWO40_06585 [Gammaproteobacteria bacterium]|nr:hypothetical protein [Gammaproteobacteria bacterium]NIR89907.1 hypothetical protein [Gammaproteobacteria bacterium]NIU03956.1 hypothetical protein [Gammaproteobacteria bacterium]NIW86656.1 hypothetical protein [Gammaproteobacteria bacterium]NIX85230.1 hypothetical protein [Gammaproteobacteria bacterium]
MHRKDLNADHLAHNEDWEDNTVALTCPRCGKVFIVIAAGKAHRGERECPACGESVGHIQGNKKAKGTAWIEW